MATYKKIFQLVCFGFCVSALLACTPTTNLSPLPSSSEKPPIPEISESSDPLLPIESVIPTPEPTATPEVLPSDEMIPDQARPQDVILDLNLNNISSEFSAYYGATLTVERQDEGIIYEQYFFPATELSKNLRFQPGDLTTGQSFTVHVSGTPDGNCLDEVILGLKPEQNTTDYLNTSAYRHAFDWELPLNGSDFTRLSSDLSCRIGYTLEGRVTDERGKPLDGVSIQAEITDDEKILYQNLQITAEPGVFSLGSLPSGVTVSLSFSKPGYRSFQTYYIDKSPGIKPEPLAIYLKNL